MRMIDFGAGPVKAYLSTWGDVFTSFYSTGIPNMQEYIGWTDDQMKSMASLGKMRPLLRIGLVRSLLRRMVPTGPTIQERAASRTLLWGEVEDDQGRKAVSRMTGPEAGTTWTAETALDAVQEVLSGHAPPGFQTPAMAYGAGIGLRSEGVSLVDVA
jgi:short subunit dehydrogenase-like uncharacterized protein